MHYYNGLSAAKLIGISYKTLLRYIERGRIVPEPGKTPTGQLVISGEQVERLRREVKRERDMFTQPQPESPAHRQHETDIDTTLNTLTHELGKWQAKVDILQAKYEELERRISELEAREYPGTRQNVVSPPVSLPATQNSSAVAGPLSASTTRKNANTSQGYLAELPPGTLGASDFTKKYGIPHSSFCRWLNIGLRGDIFEVETRPKTNASGQGDVFYFLTPEQQEKALNLLKKHNKVQ